MSLSSDPAEASPPLDPAAYRPRRPMGPMFWAMIALTLVCVTAGVVVWGLAALAPRLRADVDAPLRPPSFVTAYAPATASRPPPPPATPAAQAGPSDVAGLSARLAALEDQQARTAAAAASALASAALIEAAQTSRPFTAELATLAALSPPNAELTSLQRLAASGASSRAALSASFADYAARAAAASRAPGEGAGLSEQIGFALSRVVTLRRVGEVRGSGVDATLAKAEQFVEDGDLDQALRTLDALPPAGREAMAPWRDRAERRAEIDRRVGALRSQALEDLSRIASRAS